jgi:acetoin utilization deacetylase AcuC-like enzyme
MRSQEPGPGAGIAELRYSGVPLFLSHPSSLEHDTGSHPERALRIETLLAAVEASDLGWERILSPAVDRAVLELVHPAAHVDLIADAAARAAELGRQVALDADTLISPGSFTAALHAAGGAVEMVRRLMTDPPPPAGVPVGFSAHRPPGHHAPPDRAMGFCLFNSVAVAARYAVDVLGLERVAIVDWDVHHGNGTQDIFWTAPEVLFVSLHQMPLYPGSGAAQEIGEGDGTGFTLNLPVAPGSGDRTWVGLIADRVVERVRSFTPQLLLVSAGFDAHRDDPLAGCEVTEAGFAAMAGLLRDLAVEFQIPLGLVLEGGYDVDALARSAVAVMRELS